MGYNAESLVAAIRLLGAEIAQRRAELTHLDQEIGDGDHGENLARGFSAVLTKIFFMAACINGIFLFNLSTNTNLNECTNLFADAYRFAHS